MKTRIHVLLLILVSLGVAVLFLDEPRFGDDFTYWYHAFNLHEEGMDAWSAKSFHQIRWPVWGVCWVLQGIFGPGLISYYGAPFLYLTLGSLTAFAFGRLLFKSYGLAWGCSLVFLFHPLLDSAVETLLSRPMPDMGEGVFAAGAVLCWWFMMQAESKARWISLGAAAGVITFFAEENRLTGFFIIPLLGCLTLLFFRNRLLRLLVPFAVFAVLLAGQMAFYKAQFGAWDHFLQVNAGAKGRRGTESVALWSLPFRFLDSLAKGGVLAPLFSALAAAGLWFGWRNHGKLGRVAVAWFVLLYLAYACAPQQIYPYRPMLRDADRFLAALAIPFSVLVMIGIAGLIQLIAASPKARRFDFGQTYQSRPVLVGVVAFAVLVVLSAKPIGDREFFSLSYVNAMRAHMRALPANAKIFTHHHMRALAFMVDAETARRLTWFADDKWILDRDEKQEALARSADEFWYIRKLALLRTAKSITSDEVKKQPPLASYFDAPEREWQLAEVLARGDSPDVVMYRKRAANTPPPLILEATSLELRSLLPALPYEWKRGDTKDTVDFRWALPESLRGKLARIEMEAASDNREAFTVYAAFVFGKKVQEPAYNLKPYFFKEGGKEFAALAIPPDADACQIRVKFEKGAKWARVTNVRLVADPRQ